jgi:hypothetical protein
MAAKSNFLRNRLLDLVFGGSGYAPPATVYIGLFTVAPTNAGGGTEVSGGNYARAAVANNPSNWPAANNGIKSNGSTIAFSRSTAIWGTIVAFAAFDDIVGGNMLYWGLTTKIINSGSLASFASGTLIIKDN